MVNGSVLLDFVGVGVSKSGTSWIAKCLTEHPSIYIPEEKELHFFNNDRKYSQDLVWLRQKFPPVKEMKYGEFTPRYLINQKALIRINDHFPDIKYLVSLRNPVDRAISQHNFFVRTLKKEPVLQFEKAINGFYAEDYIEKSLYFKNLSFLFQLVDRERVEVILYDQFIDDPIKSIQGLYRFLDVDPSFNPLSINKRVNQTFSNERLPNKAELYLNRIEFNDRRYPRRVWKLARRVNKGLKRRNYLRFTEVMPQAVSGQIKESIFRKYFEKDVKRLEDLLQIDLNKWKKFE